ncbi:MAG: iron ABC transporter permease [Richelia sp. RM2_1_2]|nr:iron ABC transporter permease [Richelia sp. SM2_1_7]NJM19455.1 iron ABC transporter permease [Richelia sp. SM1_7_0]NJN09038.1 iron ABC transporter permease [Richelia sp. RM1_1_1]NJO27087.1 iron ABC transporter permease [Richelia sp. SL_2_1]NJO57194.1 iron ABC transporter permease [Richelia sp. RM2_1_2]
MYILSNRKSVIGLIIGCLVLSICVVFSVTLGAAKIPLDTIYQSFLSFDASREHLIIHTVRLPRSLLAILVGGSIFCHLLDQGITIAF